MNESLRFKFDSTGNLRNWSDWEQSSHKQTTSCVNEVLDGDFEAGTLYVKKSTISVRFI